MRKVQTERLRHYVGPVTNTDIWDEIQLRVDDVIVTTVPKSGTTWMLNIVMMMIYGQVVPEAGNREDSPWIDAAFRDRKAVAAVQSKLTRRRCLKSHTPLDGIAYGPDPTYIAVYRHPIDAHFSFRKHAENMKQNAFLKDILPEDISAGINRFITAPLTNSGTDDLTIASIAHHFTQTKTRQSKGNVHLFHYADLTKDLSGQVKRLAKILNIDLAPQTLETITDANSFASMRKAAEDSAARFDPNSPFHDPAEFFSSGTSNKWNGRLGAKEMDAYSAKLSTLLSQDDAAWLNWGDQGKPT